MKHILDFCGGCGMLLPRGMGNLPVDEQICENCGAEPAETDARIQGIFEEEAAHRMAKAVGQA